MPASTMPRPAGRERHGGQQRRDERDEERAADPDADVEAERLTTNSRRSASVVQMRTVRNATIGSVRRSTENTPSSNRS